MKRFFLVMFAVLLIAGVSYFYVTSSSTPREPASADAALALDRQIENMLEKSLPRMACNLSVGAPGSIIAAPEARDPNYYFHWIRDSGIIVRSMSRLLPFVKGTPNETAIRKFILDFANFSRGLQHSPTPQGPGETRFKVDGSIDNSVWPRPQYDGLALRALALMDFLSRSQNGELTPAQIRRLKVIIAWDLNRISRYYNRPGFDLWEYANGFHFFTRMVQLRALLDGRKLFAHRAPSEWNEAITDLTKQLQTHWHPETGVITWGGPVTDSHGKPINIHYSSYDTSVSLAMVHAAPAAGFDDLDERVWSSLWKQEDYFLKKFPVNADKTFGPAIGRDPGDDYYGGNAFFFLTAAYAEHSFRAAEALLEAKGEMIATPFRLPTLEHLLRRNVPENTKLALPNPELAEAFAQEGNAFLKTMLDVIPADGMMAEQMSKVDGSPVSAHDLTWSYASILTAVLQREEWQRSTVDFSKIHFVCPDPSIGKPRY